PCASRSLMIVAAVAGPIPGRTSSCCAFAVLRFTGVPAEGAPPLSGEGAPLTAAGSTPGTVAPTRGTATRDPSASAAARLRRVRSASGVEPPAASIASTTRAPAARRTTPPPPTAPTTPTTIAPAGCGVVVLVAGAAFVRAIAPGRGTAEDGFG